MPILSRHMQVSSSVCKYTASPLFGRFMPQSCQIVYSRASLLPPAHAWEYAFRAIQAPKRPDCVLPCLPAPPAQCVGVRFSGDSSAKTARLCAPVPPCSPRPVRGSTLFGRFKRQNCQIVYSRASLLPPARAWEYAFRAIQAPKLPDCVLPCLPARPGPCVGVRFSGDSSAKAARLCTPVPPSSPRPVRGSTLFGRFPFRAFLDPCSRSGRISVSGFRASELLP